MVTYIDIEVRIVNVKAMGRLTEIDVSNPIAANVMILDEAKGRVGQDILHKLGGRLHIALLGEWRERG